MLLGAARLYVGFDTASSLVSAQLLGGLWAAMFIVAWAGADAGRRPEPVRTLLGPPALTVPPDEPPPIDRREPPDGHLVGELPGTEESDPTPARPPETGQPPRRAVR